MAEQDQSSEVVDPNQSDESSGGQVATLPLPRTKPARPRVDRLPMWKVLLHNDDVNSMDHVAATIVMLARVSLRSALLQTIEAHTQGVALLLTTHREHAELLAEQFASRKLVVTIEPEA
jgi:ATP-dependent Clp protease adaptor protein ClpS